MKCLLIETKDKRKFLTHEKNFAQLIEFSKQFKANISLVKTTSSEILELEELAPAICDATYKKNNIEYQIIEDKITCINSNKVKTSDKIQASLKKQLLKRKSVSLKALKTKYKNFNLSDAALCNIYKKTRESLEQEGYRVVKTGAGEYKVL
jgi:hypothetical protein